MTYLLRQSRTGLIMNYLAFFLILLSSLSFLLSSPVYAKASHVGKMVFTKGVVSLIKDDKTIQVLGRGNKLFLGDVIRTGKRSKAILKLIDGTQLSLIENTHFVVKALSLTKDKEKADIHLLKGGLRAITGLVNKNNTGKFKLTTPVASIGIRGTDFTSYLCQSNCDEGKSGQIVSGNDKAKETANDDSTIQENTQVKARVVVKKGDVTAKQADGKVRQLFKNSPLYEGDTIITKRHSIVVVVFKDNTRTTIQANTEFLIENFAFKPKKPKQSHAGFKLIKGSLRFLTGKIGKINRDKYTISTPNSSIGIRGTGFDLSFTDVQVNIFVWNGAVNYSPFNGTPQLVGVNTGLQLTPIASFKARVKIKSAQGVNGLKGDKAPKIKVILKMPAQFSSGPRPDSPKINQQINLPDLFGSRGPVGKVGLYVHVKQGEVEVNSGGKKLNLGKNESGFLGQKQEPFRISAPPKFLIEPFIPPNLDQKSLKKLKVFTKLFENTNFKDNGSICEVK